MAIQNYIAIAALAAALAVPVFDQGVAWSGASAPSVLVHHVGAERALPAFDPVTYILKVADEACYRRGANEASLRVWADVQHWTPVGAEELSRQQNEFTILAGGWTVKNQVGTFALIQSRLKSPNVGRVCSIAVQPVSAVQHLQLKQAFAKKFGVDIAFGSCAKGPCTKRYDFNASTPHHHLGKRVTVGSNRHTWRCDVRACNPDAG